MSDVLSRILTRKREEVAERSAHLPLAELRARAANTSPTRGFAGAVKSCVAAGGIAVIAEIKRASPSKGLIRDPFDPAAIARSYESGGASCLSVLTDIDFFQGADAFLVEARAACALPVLRKDFIVDAWQLYESRALGADCVLLIAAALDGNALPDLAAEARALGLDVLLEVHDEAELERALEIEDVLIGVNNRNLRTFNVDLDTTSRLRARAPTERLMIAESGIQDATDIHSLRAAGVHAFLIGETFMRADDPGAALASLLAAASA